MKALLSLLLLTLCSSNLFSQDKMIVDKPFFGTTMYSNAKFITSTDQLPEVILTNVNGLIKSSLGSFSSEVTFVQGQIVDLKKEFANDTAAFRYQWVVPMYDLSYRLCDPLLGLKSYELKIRLDEYGQVLSMTWPRKYYTDRSRFIPRDRIKSAALKQAVKHNLNMVNYIVELQYDQNTETFFWQFNFLRNKDDKDADKEYDRIEINWADTGDYKISQWTLGTVN